MTDKNLAAAAHRLGLGAAASLGALLAGCTVGPNFTRPDAHAPAEYNAEKLDLAAAAGTEAKQSLELGQRISGQWWQLYKSDRLGAVMQEALSNNPKLAAAEATLGQAQEAIAQASGALWPHVQLQGSATRERVGPGTLGAAARPMESNVFTIGPNVSYALDLFGLNRRQVEQQEALAQFQGYQLDAAYLSLTGDIVTQAFTIASAREQIKAVNEIIADDEKNEGVVRDMVRVGGATQGDLAQVRTQVAADRALLPPLQQQLYAAKHALAVLVGKAPSEWAAPDFDLAEFTLPPELPVSVPSALVRQRPDILAAEAQLHAASAAIGVATAQEYPNITLSASFAQQALSPHTLFNATSSIWSFGSQLTAPIFQGGQLEAQKQGAVDAFNAQAATYRQTVLTAFGQVADVLTALENDARLVDDEHDATRQAQTAVQAVREIHRVGGATLFEVLDSERQFEQARLGYIRAQAQRFADTAQLFNAMGGGWWDWRGKSDPAAAEITPASAPAAAR